MMEDIVNHIPQNGCICPSLSSDKQNAIVFVKEQTIYEYHPFVST